MLLSSAMMIFQARSGYNLRKPWSMPIAGIQRWDRRIYA